MKVVLIRANLPVSEYVCIPLTSGKKLFVCSRRVLCQNMNTTSTHVVCCRAERLPCRSCLRQELGNDKVPQWFQIIVKCASGLGCVPLSLRAALRCRLSV